jgi:hypothetical protein
MAGKPVEHESTYKGRKVRTDSAEDLYYLYVEERLSCGDIAKIFELEDTIVSRNKILRRLQRYNIPRRDFKGENNPMWAGGKKIGKGGYILVWRPDHPYANSQGYVSEHRLVMEEHIGRYLSPDEIVHHKNKNRQDNRIENLQLLESNSAHAKLESKLRKRDKLGRFIS